ncbi:putative integral membrane protein [Leishmania donovani]|uniref:Putative integral membrane protein n=1 Tax=Leishmania donovani TaxID=5661 RepID=A0A504XWK0_LEIDO|nr:putative integral membrane protein [Leishmania donovani]
MGFLNMACGVAQWVLLGYKLDGRMSRSWYVIFIPFCFRAGLRVVEACLRSMMKYTIGVRSEIGVAFDTVGSFFSNGMLLTSLYFVAARIHRGRERVRLACALIPVYLTLLWIFLCLMVTMVLLLIFYRRRSREERRVNRQWTPPQDKYEEAAKVLGGTDTSDSGPARVFKASEHGWDDVDSVSTTFATFPADVDDHGGNEEYEDFETDEEHRPRDHVSEAADADRTPISDQGSSWRYRASRHANRAVRRGVSGLSSRRGSPERYTPEEASGVTATAASDEDDYTEVTTYMNEGTTVSRKGGDFTRSSSYSYTAQTTYVDEETDYTGQSQTTYHTRSSSYSSLSSASSIGNFAASADRSAERKR